MKNFKKWEKKVKTAFIIRVVYLAITAIALIAIIVAQETGTAFTERNYFIAMVVVIALFFASQIYFLYRLVKKVNKYYSKIVEFDEASKDPVIMKESRLLTNSVADLDLETMGTIRNLKNKSLISLEEAKETLEKTEKVLNEVKEFIEKYPTLKPTGIKDPNMLISIYNKRIISLMKSMNNA